MCKMYNPVNIVEGTEAYRLCEAAQHLYDNPPQLNDDGTVNTESLYAWLERGNVVSNDFTTFVIKHHRSSDDHGAQHEHTTFVETLPYMSAGGIRDMYEDCKRLDILLRDRTAPTAGLYEPDGSLGSVYSSVDEYYRWNFPEVRAVFLKYVMSTRNNLPAWMAK